MERPEEKRIPAVPAGLDGHSRPGIHRAVETLKEQSVHTCTVDVQEQDQLLVLVTCVDRDDERRLVAARRIREGETEAELREQVRKSR